MVGMSGLEMVMRLRQTDFRGKIIVLSGWMSGEVEHSYRKLKTEKFLPKPFFDSRTAQCRQ